MNQFLYDLISQVDQISLFSLFLHIAMSALIGLVIYLSYWLSHTGTIYSKKFNVSLVTLTILTATVMAIIGNNIALSLGMVGALSIVRFRTAIKDSRDTVYIFWTIVAGLGCGVGDYVTSAIGSAIVFIVLLILSRIKNDNRMLLIIRGARSTERQIEGVVFNYFNQKAILRVKNTTPDTLELIYELPRSSYRQSLKKEVSVTDALYQVEHIEYVNVVAQDDDISS